MKFKIGTSVQKTGDKTVNGKVTRITKWNQPNGYQGYVYEFKDDTMTYFGHMEDEIEATE
ncbi:MAG: hypothetical protein FWD01_03360 [Defluviitaleaceae bacterium]|nr:hypothetical protein [Defluviitaleaceae bacterium]